MNFYLSLCCLLIVGANFANAEQQPSYIYTPGSCQAVVNLYLYTPEHRTWPEKVTINSPMPSYYIPDRPTIIITHGINDSYKSESCTLIRDEYLSMTKQKVNLMVFDWGHYSNVPADNSLNLIRRFGEYIHDVITFTGSKVDLNLKSVTLVGHGEGAQIMANVGARSNGRIKTIWALDPYPVAETGGYLTNQLNFHDAEYVNVIHTSARGGQRKLGTADYYPNGGLVQPGCEETDHECSHARAYKLFAESIRGYDGFRATACDTVQNAIDGRCNYGPSINVVNGLSLTYYYKTNKASPYGCGIGNCTNP